MLRYLLLSAGCGLALGALLAAVASDPASPSDGRALFEKRCTGCHALDHEKSGPRLAGVFGRRAGSVAGFPYSSALRSSNIIWNAKNLDRWLADPDQLAPGNDMAFRLENAEERAKIIGYLRQSGTESELRSQHL
jgi:cytochrome c